MNIINITINRAYQYGVATFEHSRFVGCLPVSRRDLEPLNSWQLGNRYWADVNRFYDLSEEERDKYRIQNIEYKGDWMLDVNRYLDQDPYATI